MARFLRFAPLRARVREGSKACPTPRRRSDLSPGPWIARQHKLSDTAIHKRAKAKGWTRDLSGVVRTRVRESLVCEVRAKLIAGDKPSDAAIIDEAAAIGLAVVRSHRRDIDALREAAAGLLGELGAPTQWDEDGVLVVVPLIHRSLISQTQPFASAHRPASATTEPRGAGHQDRDRARRESERTGDT